MFLVALFSRCYWMVGSILGGILGQIIPFDLTGIDFCMTALFLIIFIDQWEKARKHTPALTGLGIGVICLLIFGENHFMLPALLIVSAILLLFQRRHFRCNHIRTPRTSVSCIFRQPKNARFTGAPRSGTAVSHHGSSDCLLYERYPIRRYLCRSAKITRRSSRLHHLQMETPDTDLHPARNDFLYGASASLLTILLFAKKERSHKLLSKFVTAFFFSCYAPINTFFPANANP